MTPHLDQCWGGISCVGWCPQGDCFSLTPKNNPVGVSTGAHRAQECARPSQGHGEEQNTLSAGPRACIPTDQTHMGAINLPFSQLPP